MILHRTEFDISSGRLTVINQYVYKNADGNIIALDCALVPPDGYVRIFEMPADEADQSVK